ncbi:MAG: UDP-diphosphatase [Flavobacteriaceae bacterium CG_4_8_14_3_um_filter_34_10]|nr:MAG: UDP-diphosphatase [Flavobacteriaceae bacterium CG2_30_34_30]PIQ17419.1 MAG: UDP-diphosphatase [Flavobacteriaceae bacterium CG18_big_fil_WC_8_21_14_2_50_34_36]PIV50659.1 MAG: UDP-diphosphatase [Flavobacteriaceae bacterium CG02_land_8_20_14_3_00_34_13]PIX09655.1 MAG: UDP-diphosphatase [Flavobacteriaceae bacterium CG_4_8_14_3_um_filter_34_10]PIZ08725.1 MAG: UDP-diphosphatase [Flavobacteriaceae bacterium CG_4_10_14_0_8_um_filter_34_31]PJC06191.1 MAG: UDP-diphosphatase [Flavobacteriaceae ba
MNYIDALILGAVQGLTEFLPVSSSGHLEIGKVLVGDQSMPQESLLFTVVVHFATALSTIVVFRKDIFEIVQGIFQWKWNEEFKFSLKILLSMVPAVIIGLAFSDQLEAFFNGDILFVGFMLIITALLLWLADRAKKTTKKVSFKSAFVIGVAQAIAILPGISRSGATIATSVLLGIDRARAARFSFLMVVPLILGKITKDILSGNISTETSHLGLLTAGFLAAFVFGIFACTWMIAIVKKSKLSYFAVYCFVVGVISIIFGYYS